MAYYCEFCGKERNSNRFDGCKCFEPSDQILNSGLSLRHCPKCGGTLPPSGLCSNPICKITVQTDSSDDYCEKCGKRRNAWGVDNCKCFDLNDEYKNTGLSFRYCEKCGRMLPTVGFCSNPSCN